MKTLALTFFLLLSCLAFTQNDNTTLHFYRPKMLYGCGWTYKVKVNDKVLKIRNGKVTTVTIPTGNISIEILDIGKQKISINQTSGGDYYFRATITPGVFPMFGRPIVVPTETYFAQSEILRLK